MTMRLYNLKDGTITGYGDALATVPHMVPFDDADRTAVPRLEVLRRARDSMGDAADARSPYQVSMMSLETATQELRAVYEKQANEAGDALKALDLADEFVDQDEPAPARKAKPRAKAKGAVSNEPKPNSRAHEA